MRSLPEKSVTHTPPRGLALELRVMHPITLELGLAEHDGYVYPSIVLDYSAGETVAVSVPMQGGQEIPVPPGTKVSFSTSQQDGVLTCHTQVLERDGGSFLPALLLAWPEGMKKVNRRRSPRHETRVPVDLTYSCPEASTPVAIRGVTTDLSELGMRLVVREPIAEGARLAVRLHLPDDSIHVCDGCVVRRGASEPPGGGVINWIGVEFRNVTPEVQRGLRRHLSSIQLGSGSRASE